MGGAPTPKWDPIGFDPQPFVAGTRLSQWGPNPLDAANAFDGGGFSRNGEGDWMGSEHL